MRRGVTGGGACAGPRSRGACVLRRGPIVAFIWMLAAAPAVAGAAEEGRTAGATGAEAAQAEGHGDEPINWHDFTNRKTAPILALLANFAILLGILVYFGRKPMKVFLDERRDTLMKDMDEAQAAKVAAEGRLYGFDVREKKLDEETAHLREDLLRIGYDERDRIVADAGARAEKIRREAELVAAEEQRRAQREVRAKVVEAALAEAERELRERLAAADQTRLAEEFVRRIEEDAGG